MKWDRKSARGAEAEIRRQLAEVNSMRGDAPPLHVYGGWNRASRGVGGGYRNPPAMAHWYIATTAGSANALARARAHSGDDRPAGKGWEAEFARKFVERALVAESERSEVVLPC